MLEPICAEWVAAPGEDHTGQQRPRENVILVVFDVDDLKLAGLVGVNTAVTERAPAGRLVYGPIDTPRATVTGAPRLVVPPVNQMVPRALNGVTCAMEITKPLNPSGSGTQSTDNVVVVVTAPGVGVGVTVRE